MRSTALAIGTTLAALLLSVLVGVPAALAGGADPYSPTVPAECSLVVDAHVRDGDRFEARARVAANVSFRVVGTVTFKVSRDRGRAGHVLWKRTVAYRGSVAEVSGPVLSRRGHFAATMRFRATAPTVEGCGAAQSFTVGGSGHGNLPAGPTAQAESPTGTIDPSGPTDDPTDNRGPGGAGDDAAPPGGSDDDNDDGSWPFWVILVVAGILGGGAALASRGD